MTSRNSFFPLFFLALLLPPAAAQAGLDCFTVVAGRKATSDGSVLLVHNEDDGGNPSWRFWRIPPMENPEGEAFRLVNGGEIPFPRHTPGYFWAQIPEVYFGDFYVNQWGLSFCSNACISKEKNPELKEGGLTHLLRRILALRCRTAREAVETAVRLLGEWGYSPSGRTLFIADPREAWLLCMVRGKHWIAVRVPDDKVAVVSNSYPVQEVDLSDKANVLAPPDLVSYAEKKGWYDPSRDGPFNFAKAYAPRKNLEGSANVLRRWRGICLLSGKKWPRKWNLPTFIRPAKKLGPSDLMRVMRDHYEGTKYDLTRGYEEGDPNETKVRTICHKTTRATFLLQLRADLPMPLGALLWFAPRKPDTSLFLPWYPLLPELPPGFSKGDWRKIQAAQLGRAPLPEGRVPSMLPFLELAEKTGEDYGKRIRAVKALQEKLETAWLDSREKAEALALELLREKRPLGIEFLTSLTFGRTALALKRIRALLRKWKAPEKAAIK